MGMKKDRAVQGEGGVHLSLIPELGNEWKRALREGVHLEGVDCIHDFLFHNLKKLLPSMNEIKKPLYALYSLYKVSTIIKQI